MLLRCETAVSPFDKNWMIQLMDHLDDMINDNIMRRHLEDILSIFQDLNILGTRFSEREVRHAYGVLRVNSFGVDTLSGGSGRALYPLTALASHSCRPNVNHNQTR